MNESSWCEEASWGAGSIGAWPAGARPVGGGSIPLHLKSLGSTAKVFQIQWG